MVFAASQGPTGVRARDHVLSYTPQLQLPQLGRQFQAIQLSKIYRGYGSGVVYINLEFLFPSHSASRSFLSTLIIQSLFLHCYLSSWFSLLHFLSSSLRWHFLRPSRKPSLSRSQTVLHQTLTRHAPQDAFQTLAHAPEMPARLPATSMIRGQMALALASTIGLLAPFSILSSLTRTRDNLSACARRAIAATVSL